MARLRNPVAQLYFDRAYPKSRDEGGFFAAYLFAAAAGHAAPRPGAYSLRNPRRVAKLTRFANQIITVLRAQAPEADIRSVRLDQAAARCAAKRR